MNSTSLKATASLIFPSTPTRCETSKFKQCTSSAGEQKQHGILRRQAAHQLQCLLGGRKTVLVRHRMACFITIYSQNFAPDVLVFGRDARRRPHGPALPPPRVPSAMRPCPLRPAAPCPPWAQRLSMRGGQLRPAGQRSGWMR